ELLARPEIPERVVTGFRRAASGLAITRTGAFLACHFGLATRSDAGQHDLRLLKASLRDQLVERCGILRRATDATMRRRLAEALHLIAAVDRMTGFHEKDRMRDGSVVPFLAVPDLVHG